MTPLSTLLVLLLLVIAAAVTFLTAKADKPTSTFKKYGPLYAPTGIVLSLYPLSITSRPIELFLLLLVTIQILLYSGTLFLLLRAKHPNE